MCQLTSDADLQLLKNPTAGESVGLHCSQLYK